MVVEKKYIQTGTLCLKYDDIFRKKMFISKIKGRGETTIALTKAIECRSCAEKNEYLIHFEDSHRTSVFLILSKFLEMRFINNQLLNLACTWGDGRMPPRDIFCGSTLQFLG